MLDLIIIGLCVVDILAIIIIAVDIRNAPTIEDNEE